MGLVNDRRLSKSVDSTDIVIHHFLRTTRRSEDLFCEDAQSHGKLILLPSTSSPDAAISKLFMQDYCPGKQVLRGRATFSSGDASSDHQPHSSDDSESVSLAPSSTPTKLRPKSPSTSRQIEHPKEPPRSKVRKDVRLSSANEESIASLPLAFVSTDEPFIELTPHSRYFSGGLRRHDDSEMDGSVERGHGQTLLPPIRFKSSPASVMRLDLENAEDASIMTPKGYKRLDPDAVWGPDSEWDPEELLRLTNNVRETLASSIIEPDDFRQLDNFIKYFLYEIKCPNAPENIEIGLISLTRLDKLLEEVVGMERVHTEYNDLISKASDLQQKWKRQFGGRYQLIDEERFKAMMDSGALRDMYCRLSKTGIAMWKIDRNLTATHPEIIVGQWWPSTVCVVRDGIVSDVKKIISTGAYGDVLLLLQGEETEGRTLDTYTYTFQSRQMFGPFGLVLEMRKIFKVLRGHELKSLYAPKAGIRYDGEYKIESYAQAPREHAEDIGTFCLHLVRLDGQKSVNFIRNIPTPAQMDEAKLYDIYTKGVQAQGDEKSAHNCFFTHLLGKVSRSPDVPSKTLMRVIKNPTSSKGKDLQEKDFSFDDIFT